MNHLLNDLHDQDRLLRENAAADVLAARNISVSFETPQGWVPTIHSVDLMLKRGEILGLVGESGSGKSVTCQALLGLLPPSARVSGAATVNDRSIPLSDAAGLAALRGRMLSMVFQDPMSALDPLMSVRRHLMQRLRRHGATGDLTARARDLLHRAGVSDSSRILDAYPHQLSGGLCQRVAIALALAGSPRLLVADEPTTALDVTIQAQVLDLFAELRESEGIALILISHDLGVVAEICDRIAVMYAGQIVEEGPVEEALLRPAHPYAEGLIASRPDIDAPRGRLKAIRGSAAAPGALDQGCPFAPRCDAAASICQTNPPLRHVGANHTARCHFAGGTDA